MHVYLLLWKAEKFPWISFEDELRTIANDGYVEKTWSCGKTKSIKPGDRIFFRKVGKGARGIFPSGYARSTPFWDKHWDGSAGEALFVKIEIDAIVNPNIHLLDTGLFKSESLRRQNWKPMISGISNNVEILNELETEWFEFLDKQRFFNQTDTKHEFLEGYPNLIQLTRYERNPHARKRCLEYYGYECAVCTFSFEEKYGPIGEGYIEVHHLNPISTCSGERKTDPEHDLRPVCSNCHRRNPPYTIEELKKIIQRDEN